jgi:hypothetical protein
MLDVVMLARLLLLLLVLVVGCEEGAAISLMVEHVSLVLRH